MSRRNTLIDIINNTSKHFINLPRHQRSERVIQLKNKIKRYSDPGEHFFSHGLLTGKGAGSFYFSFPGKNRFDIWHMDLITCETAYWSKVSDKAFSVAYNLLSKNEIHDEFSIDRLFVAGDRDKNGKILSYRMREDPEIRYPQFKGLSFDEYQQEIKQELDVAGEIRVCESLKIDTRCQTGVIVTQTLNEPMITRDLVDRIITELPQNPVNRRGKPLSKSKIKRR